MHYFTMLLPKLKAIKAAAILPLLLLLLQAMHTSTQRLGGGCLLSESPGVQKLMKKLQRPVPLYQGYPCSPDPVQGVHLALDGPQTLRVTWMNPVAPESGHFYPVCSYWAEESGNLSYVAKGQFYNYTAGMFSHTLNTAILDLSVIPCHNSSSSKQSCVRAVSYQCGDKAYGFSKVMRAGIHDKTVPLAPGPQFAIVGDMGVPHGLKTIDSIAAHMSSSSLYKSDSSGVQMVLHAGDISYADHYDTKNHNNSYVWVDYMNSLQSVAALAPYMTAPGNHEAEFHFSAYLNWLPMPHSSSESSSPFWFSFDYLGVHVLSFSTEHDFSPNSTQHHWIQQDLQKANKNRAQVPWVIVMGHRPLYCSSWVCYSRCHVEAPKYRSHLEDLLNEQHVDVVISGHNHQYERSYPVYHGNLTQKDYINPKAPVYIVNGAAGNPELNDPTFEPHVDWRAWYKITMDTGFLLMTPSSSQLHFEYVMSDNDNVIDSFTIIRK